MTVDRAVRDDAPVSSSHHNVRPHSASRRSRRSAWAQWLLGGLLVVAVTLIGLSVVIRATTSDGTQADPETGGVVVLNRLRIPVDRELPGYELPDATVWEASPAPQAEFDTSSLGPDWSFSPGQPPLAAFAGLEGDVVYLGDQNGKPMILHATAAVERNPWDHIYALFTGHGDRRILDATFPCCAFGNDQDETVSPQVLWPRPVGGPIVQWLGAPLSTSVVAIEVDGEPVGFQRPAGGIVTMELSASPPLVITITAFDSAGNALATMEYPIEPILDR